MEEINVSAPSLVPDNLPGGKAIQRLRQEAIALLNQGGLPDTKSEEYKHTPLRRTLEKTFAFKAASARGNITATVPFLIDGLEASLAVFVNGVFSASLSSIDDELKVSPIADGKDEPETVEQLSRMGHGQEDPFTVWNSVAWASGIKIHVDARVRVKRPLMLLYIYDTRQGAAHAFVRNILHMGKGSQLEIIEKTESLGDSPFFSNVVQNGLIEQDCRLTWTVIQNSQGRHVHYGHLALQQLDNSQIECNTYCLNGEFLRNNLSIAIDGGHCEGHMYGLYLLKGKTFVDNHTVMDHRKADSYSNEMYRGVLDEQSRGVFNGKIFVRPNAQKTNAFQANRNILLTDQAVVHTKPQLEIWADDVKCSHGCTSGQLDNDALFYLRSRGIPEDIAKGMLLYAFVYETFGHIKNEALKEYITRVVSERLHKSL